MHMQLKSYIYKYKFQDLSSSLNIHNLKNLNCNVQVKTLKKVFLLQAFMYKSLWITKYWNRRIIKVTAGSANKCSVRK